MLNIEKKPLNRGLSSLSFKIIKFINIFFKANFAKKINQKLTYNSHETNLIFKIYNYVIQFIYYPNIFKKLDSIFSLKKMRVSLPDLKKIRELEIEYKQIK